MRALVAASLAGALLSCAAAAAQPELKVSSAFAALEIRPDDLVTYTVTVSGEDVPSLRHDPRPDFSAFVVTSGPSRGTSSSVSMAGGRATMSSSLKLTWQLMPRGGEEGEFVVPAFDLSLGSLTLRVPPASLKTSLRAAPSGRGARGGRSGGGDPFGAYRRGDEREEPHLEVRTRISGREVYLGEELVLTHVLEFGPEAMVRTFDPEPVEFAGFEKQELKVEHSARRVAGETWQEVPLAQWKLVPLTIGEREIPARGYVLHLQPRSRDLFEGIFGGRDQQARRATEAIPLVVKPFPPGAPREFSGAVGSFQLESSLGTTSLRQGDGTTLRVLVRGTGNFAGVSAPSLQLPPGMRAFDPEVRLDVRPGRDGLTTGSKVFEYPLLIEAAGEFSIGAMSWSYLDPKSGRYVNRETRPMSLVAAASAVPATLASGPGSRTSLVETLDTDIAHVVTAWSPLLQGEARPVGLPSWFWPLLAAGPVLPILGALWSFTRRFRTTDAATTRSKRAGKEARQRLAASRAAAKAGDALAAADAAAAAVSRFVVDRCAVGGAEPVAAEVVALVRERAGEALAARVQAHLADCDFLRFAGASTGLAEAHQRAVDAEQLFGELERAFAKAGGRT